MDLASSVTRPWRTLLVSRGSGAIQLPKRPMSGGPQLGVFSGSTRKREALIPLSERVHGVHGGLSPVRTQRICEHTSNLDRKIRLETLAEMGGLSVRHFSRPFKQSVRMPPHC